MYKNYKFLPIQYILYTRSLLKDLPCTLSSLLTRLLLCTAVLWACEDGPAYQSTENMIAVADSDLMVRPLDMNPHTLDDQHNREIDTSSPSHNTPRVDASLDSINTNHTATDSHQMYDMYRSTQPSNSIDMSMNLASDMGIDSRVNHSLPPCRPTATFCADLSDWSTGQATNYPIVLVHGFLGWDQVLWVEYFYQVPERLHQAGASVYVAELDPINHSEIRAPQLATFVEKVLSCTCSEKVNLIAHSQGGIDARYLIGPLGRQEWVASITTISTPHHGFELADDVLAESPTGIRFFEALSTLFTWVTGNRSQLNTSLKASLASMSIAERTRYHQQWADQETIPIYSYAGFTSILSDGGPHCQRIGPYAGDRGDLIEPALWLTYQITGGRARPNDGLVPVDSAMWGEFLGCIPADHFDQIGQILGLSDFDYLQFYLEHLTFLRNRGH